MRFIFFGCISLTNIDLSNFISQNVTDMSGMFCGCNSLTIIDLSNCNTQKVTDMRSIFTGYKSLAYINFQILIHKMLLI